MFMMVNCLLMTTTYSQDFTFERAMPKKKSETSIFSIAQDHNGFIWFATRDGLWRFDGYESKEYRYNPGDVNSIGSSQIRSLLVDRSGILWAGTIGGGLNRYVADYDIFERYVYKEGDNFSLSHNDVLNIYQDKDSTIWVCTEDGINKLNQETGTFDRYYMEVNPIVKQLNRAMVSCLEDSDGNFWVSSYYGGLFLFNRQKGTHEHFDISRYMDTRDGSPRFFLWNLYEDSKENIWISTRGQGIVLLNIKSDSSAHFHTNGSINRRLSSNTIYTVFEDNQGNFWIGTDNGLNIYNPRNDSIEYYYTDIQNPSSISNDEVWAITQDSAGAIWLGGWEGYADKWDPLSKRFTPRISKGIFPLHPANFNCIEIDHKGRYLIGTDSGFYLLSDNIFNSNTRHFVIDHEKEGYLSGMYIPAIISDWFEYTWVGTNRGLWRFKSDPSEAELVVPGFITALYEDSRKTIWVGTQSGLLAYQRLTDSFITYESTPFTAGSLSHKNVTTIYEDHNGVLWVGTNNGLNRFNLATNSFTVFHHNHNDASSLSNGVVRQIFQDSRGMLWVGTSSGLSCAVDYSGKFRNFTINDGLAGNSVSSVFEDQSNNIWVATNEGVSKLLIETNGEKVIFDNLYDFDISFINYDIRDGLLDMSFRAGSFYQLENGEVLLGGVYGVSSFFPDRIKVNQYEPPVVLTGLKIMNNNFKADPLSKTLKKNVEQAEVVVLNHKQTVITFEYVGLSFTNSDNNQYSYMLEGFDSEWVEVGDQRAVTFTNLDAGEYLFKVRASNSDGVWNMEGATLLIKVLPPPWLSWHAFVIYLILLFFSGLVAGKIIIARQKAKSRLKLEKMESDKIREMDYFKNIFFTNISHEFRTPLTLIISPLKEISEHHELSVFLKKQINLIYKNSLRLLKLINQLLEISKIEAGHIRLKVSKGDIVYFTRSIVEAFYYKAEDLGISYHFHCNAESAMVYFDSDKIEKIIYNLLSNAFKNTPGGGSIDVFLYVHNNPNQKQEFEIVVQDNGKGISLENQKRIFERYYAYSKDAPNSPSTGIGLSLSNQLAIIHKGCIELESAPGKGSKFTVRIPASADDYTNDSLLPSAELSSNDNPVQERLTTSDNLYLETTDVNHESMVLLVEDNEDLRQYIAERLSLNYVVLTATNGEEGLELAFEKLPDIIISDVMMPRMDGFELCKVLKEDERTSHIPVILLTAKVNSESRREGYELGADDYISKPFEIGLLSVRIKNLIENRNTLRQLFSKGFALTPGKVNIPSMEEKFIQSAIHSVESHMDDPEYNVDILCQEIGMSRSQVFRKLKALTDFSPVEFIRMLRIKRAAQILSQNSHSISEIAYMVGFSDIDYFRKCFKSQFGVTPSRYSENEQGR
jgi:ligand-binding sensor domain-containing protein/signal transduction histidine kinase/DNA-binding response OmpR family regulator